MIGRIVAPSAIHSVVQRAPVIVELDSTLL